MNFRTLALLLLAVLSWGALVPEAARAAMTAAPCKCCCADGGVCHCHAMKGKPSCTMTRVQAPEDKQVPPRAVAATSPLAFFVLFVIAASRVVNPASAAVLRARKLDGSPPFGGRPAQAVLRLWLI